MSSAVEGKLSLRFRRPLRAQGADDGAGLPHFRAGHRFQFGHAAFARVRAFSLGDESVFGLVKYNELSHLARELRSY